MDTPLEAAAATTAVRLGVSLEKRCEPERLHDRVIGGRGWRVADPVTFTPFASARACSARCVFCSETLVHKGTTRLSATLRPGPGYHDGLRGALEQLRSTPFGLSLSGLESTDDPDWLEATLDEIDAHERAGGRITERVLYTNGAGLSARTHGARLVLRLVALGLTRAEVSRHHHEQERNDAIMRFRAGVSVREQGDFEETVKRLAGNVAVRLVCVVQRGGVESPEACAAYVRWARSLGVRDVVFREFSRLHDLYEPNATQRTIESRRVAIEHLVDGAARSSVLEPTGVTLGYYYWNARFVAEGDTVVTFETSDYRLMKDRHASGVVWKLVYHANGNLCSDWDPGREILWSAGGRTSDTSSQGVPVRILRGG